VAQALPLTDNDGFEYTDLAAARGTTLDTTSSSSHASLAPRRLKCMILEGCDSIAENQASSGPPVFPLTMIQAATPLGVRLQTPLRSWRKSRVPARTQITRTWVQVDGQGNSPNRHKTQ